MEPFFPEPLPRYHVEKAAISGITGTPAWPPKVATFGFARCVRFWRPLNPKKPEFSPVASAQAGDGVRYIAAAFLGNKSDVVVTVDATPMGKVVIWSCPDDGDKPWDIQQTLCCGSPAASLVVEGDYIAVGTLNGSLLIWKGADGRRFQPAPGFASGPRTLDSWPLTLLAAGVGSQGEALLAVVLPGKKSIATVHMAKGAVMYTGLQVEMESGAELACLNVRHAILLHGSLACISWDPGHETQVAIMALDGKGGGLLESDQRLQGHGEPLCCDFDGQTLAIGFADGAVSGFGVKGFLRWHGGAVGAVRVVPAKSAVISGAADGTVNMWDRAGTLIGQLRYPEAITALHSCALYSLVGMGSGAWDLLVHAVADDVASAASKPSPESIKEASIQPEAVRTYDLAFDSRCTGSGCAATQHSSPAEFREFVPQIALPAAPPPPAPSALSGASSSGAEEVGTKETSASSFDMKKGLKGAARSEEELTPSKSTEASREAMRKLEGSGVARNTEVRPLASATAAIGRKCDSTTCLAREGVGNLVFKRCGHCRSAWYCSAHCQATHWRQGHKAACEALKQQAPGRLEGAQTLTTTAAPPTLAANAAKQLPTRDAVQSRQPHAADLPEPATANDAGDHQGRDLSVAEASVNLSKQGGVDAEMDDVVQNELQPNNASTQQLARATDEVGEGGSNAASCTRVRSGTASSYASGKGHEEEVTLHLSEPKIAAGVTAADGNALCGAFRAATSLDSDKSVGGDSTAGGGIEREGLLYDLD